MSYTGSNINKILKMFGIFSINLKNKLKLFKIHPLDRCFCDFNPLVLNEIKSS
jgi:hypothetical protein